MRTTLENLSRITIASPCDANWDEMTGDDHVRFCGKCEKSVYNLSALTTEQAFRLIREKEGHLCTRFFRRADGTMLTVDCPAGVRHRIRRQRRLAAFAASLAGLLGFSGCAKLDDERGKCVMGKPTGIVRSPARPDAPESGTLQEEKDPERPELVPPPRTVQTTSE